MNRENFISFITDSVAVKKNLVDARLVENRQADTIQKYLDSLDDESLETLCIQQGYSAETESTITTAKAVQEDNSVAFLPSWKQFEAECDDINGATIKVPAVNVTLVRRKTIRRSDGTRYIGIIGMLADNTRVTVNSDDLAQAWSAGAIGKGDVIPLKAVYANSAVLNGVPTKWYTASPLLSADNILSEYLEDRLQREEELATKSQGAQLKIQERLEDNEVEDFFAKFGKKTV